MRRQGRLTAGLGRTLGFAARAAAVAAAAVLVTLGAVFAGAFAILVAAYGCLSTTLPGRTRPARAQGIGTVDSVRLAEIPVSQ